MFGRLGGRRRRASGRPLNVQSYVPIPLAENDPDDLVASQMLTPLLIAVCASMLKTSTGTESGRGRAAMRVGFVIVAGLADALIVGPWVQGAPHRQGLDRVAHLVADRRLGRPWPQSCRSCWEPRACC